MTPSNTTKILLVALVVALVFGVWGLRRYQDAREETTAATLDAQTLDLGELKAAGRPILLNFGGET
ncbi:MAG: hypothetical protein FWE87_01160 [Coriobacteriia bacterium]|nr:hypothetical protein [Coriobacteriia bacterium]